MLETKPLHAQDVQFADDDRPEYNLKSFIRHAFSSQYPQSIQRLCAVTDDVTHVIRRRQPYPARSFLPARRYASAGYRDRNVPVRPSVRLSVRHAPVLCQNEES